MLFKTIATQQGLPHKPQPAINVTYNVDVVQFLLLFCSIAASCVSLFVGWGASKQLKQSKLKKVLARIKPDEFDIDDEIERYLVRILETTGGSRAIVALFTNGLEAGIYPFRFFTIFWEKVKDGVAPIKFDYQKVPFGKIREEYDLCAANPRDFVITSLNQDLNDGCRAYLLSKDIHTVISRLFGDEKDGFIGILNIQFNYDPGEITPQQKSKLNDLFIVLNSKIEATHD